MIKRNLFRKPQNELENHGKTETNLTEEMRMNCPSCRSVVYLNELGDYYYICRKCGYHFRINARQRIDMLTDEGSFEEFDCDLRSQNIIGFPEYDHKLKNAVLQSAENEAVITGTARFGGFPCADFVMEPQFMMGSMGLVVGEKITRLFEYATEHDLPVIGSVVSGGARMQEGMFSLMQMAKTSGAVKRHSDGGNLYISILTDPTSGGVMASFAMQADVIIAEPKALICFAGPRVIEQIIRHKLPAGFQKAEFLLEKGFLDAIVDRRQQRDFLAKLLKFHQRGTIS